MSLANEIRRDERADAATGRNADLAGLIRQVQAECARVHEQSAHVASRGNRDIAAVSIVAGGDNIVELNRAPGSQSHCSTIACREGVQQINVDISQDGVDRNIAAQRLDYAAVHAHFSGQVDIAARSHNGLCLVDYLTCGG